MSPKHPKDHLLEKMRGRGAAEGLSQGSLSLSEFMEFCLYDPDRGYYMGENPVGKDGAFTTAPEISQLFGEMIGLWAVQNWIDLGSPRPFCLVEMGPGRGTLMKDLLRATRSVPGFHQALHLKLVELSPSLQAQQQETLSFPNLEWFASLDKALERAPSCPTLFIGNEFFDALPLNQYIQTTKGWREKKVSRKGDHLEFILSPLQNDYPFLESDLPEGSVYEHTPAMEPLVNSISSHVRSYGGGGLFIDYGYFETAYKNTFQALYRHQYSDPLEHIGESDLTYHVNFKALADLFFKNGIPQIHLMTQRDFLESQGIHTRATLLNASASERQQQDINKGLHRLIHDMGQLFKVMAFTQMP